MPILQMSKDRLKGQTTEQWLTEDMFVRWIIISHLKIISNDFSKSLDISQHIFRAT